jgi:hypothetical protein
MNRLKAGRSRDRGLIPGWGKILFFLIFSKAFRMDLRPDQLSIRRIAEIISSKVKRQSREATEVKYEWR